VNETEKRRKRQKIVVKGRILLNSGLRSRNSKIIPKRALPLNPTRLEQKMG